MSDWLTSLRNEREEEQEEGAAATIDRQILVKAGSAVSLDKFDNDVFVQLVLSKPRR